MKLKANVPSQLLPSTNIHINLQRKNENGQVIQFQLRQKVQITLVHGVKKDMPIKEVTKRMILDRKKKKNVADYD